ncbi:MAG: C39 family peptidase [Prevotella sp.]|nr:C39 family peptidase [Staphylococcus sp.]MCM1349756.1 C39 family peptidase [Prevotella sp.]
MKYIKGIIILCMASCLLMSCKEKHQHQLVEDEEILPTCETAGLTKGTHCAECGEVIIPQTIINASGHQWMNASCDAAKTCSVCNKTSGDSLEHQYGEWYLAEEATYEKEGKREKECLLCHQIVSETVPMLQAVDKIHAVIASLVLPDTTSQNLVLPIEQDGVSIVWRSNKSYIMTNEGVISKTSANRKVELEAAFRFQEVEVKQTYVITVLAYTTEEKLQLVMDTFTFPKKVYQDLVLYENLSYHVQAIYTSSQPIVCTHEGKIMRQKEEVEIEFHILLMLEGESLDKVFYFTVAAKEENDKRHQIVVRTDEMDVDAISELEVHEQKLRLQTGQITGKYVSPVIETEAFTSLVASWSAITSSYGTVELQLKARVDGVWSDYITYSPWGLGLQNQSHDQNNGIICLSTDEVKVLNGKKATGIQFQVILCRNRVEVDSPALSLVSFALEIPNYQYQVDVTGLPEYICYDVPQLNQNVVPTIGGSICSATSTTMLLKYKGLDFTTQDQEFEHRYIASIVRDYGNQIYGNWVYNTVAMGGYGFDAYVARMYSVNELIQHLATVGPVALSVKGTMISSEKTYTTNGHLIVAIGYRYVDGELFILCNDPNVPRVYCEYAVSVIEKTWRNIVYVIE